MPATQPPNHANHYAYSKGDLIEIVSNRGKKRSKSIIAIIQRINESDFGGKTAIVGVSREEGQRWLLASSIRFHSPNFASIEGEGDVPSLCALLTKFNKEVEENFGTVLERVKEISRVHANHVYLDRLIYYDDLVHRVFGSGKDQLSACQSYLIYRTMKMCRLIHDSQSNLVNVYRPPLKRIYYALNILWNAKSSGRFDQLKSDLYSAAFYKNDLMFSSDSVNSAALTVLEHFAVHSDDNELDEHIVDMIKDMLDGVWPSTCSNDVIMLLKRINGFSLARSIPFKRSIFSEYDEFDTVAEIALRDATQTNHRSLTINTGEIIAIDAGDTKEVDDALCVSEDENGNVWLHIHIADPSKCILPHSVPDKLARSKVSTVYLPEVTRPMLSEAIVSASSLSPDRVFNQTVVFSIKLGENGDIVDYRFSECSAIKVIRMTYDQCDDILNSPQHPRHNILSKIYSLTKSHLSFRQSNGMIDISLQRPKILLSKDSTVKIEWINYKRPSFTLVSESMVMAGRVAALLGTYYAIPLPFRSHQRPSKEYSNETESLEYKLCYISTLKPSAIDALPRQHWGMGIFEYVKATSPLRRYLDLFTHQQLKAVLISKTAPPYSSEELRSILPRIYSGELYIKGLQQTVNKYWLLVHLQTELQSKGPIDTDCIYLGESRYFLLLYNTTFFIRAAGNCAEYTRLRLRLQSADPMRMCIEAQIMK